MTFFRRRQPVPQHPKGTAMFLKLTTKDGAPGGRPWRGTRDHLFSVSDQNDDRAPAEPPYSICQHKRCCLGPAYVAA